LLLHILYCLIFVSFNFQVCLELLDLIRLSLDLFEFPQHASGWLTNRLEIIMLSLEELIFVLTVDTGTTLLNDELLKLTKDRGQSVLDLLVVSMSSPQAHL